MNTSMPNTRKPNTSSSASASTTEWWVLSGLLCACAASCSVSVRTWSWSGERYKSVLCILIYSNNLFPTIIQNVSCDSHSRSVAYFRNVRVQVPCSPRSHVPLPFPRFPLSVPFFRPRTRSSALRPPAPNSIPRPMLHRFPSPAAEPIVFGGRGQRQFVPCVSGALKTTEDQLHLVAHGEHISYVFVRQTPRWNPVITRTWPGFVVVFLFVFIVNRQQVQQASKRRSQDSRKWKQNIWRRTLSQSQ